MGRIKKIILILWLTFMMVGCGKDKVSITIMDGFLPNENVSANRNEAYKTFEKRIDEWNNSHPLITVEERKQYHGSELGSLGTLGAEHLPDIFVLSGTTGRVFYQEGLILDLSEYISDDEDSFFYDGVAYAFPVFNPSYTVIAFDKKAWEPGESVAIGTNEANVISCLMTDEAGQTWFDHIISGDKEAAFVDEVFMECLIKTNELLQEKGTISDFINGDCRAILLSGDGVYNMLERVKDENPELYERTAFTTFDGEHMPCGYERGLFLNVKLADNPEKLKECLSLCRYLSDSNIDLVDEKLKNILYEKNSTVLWSQFLPGDMGGQLSRVGIKNANLREISARMQDYYEEYYLNIEDYSKQLDKYTK